MELDERLRKITTGGSVADAIDTYLRGLSTVEVDGERAEERLAIVELMFLMAAVDGDVAIDEIAQLRASLEAIPGLGSTGLHLEETLVDLADKLALEGWKSRLDQAAAKIRDRDARSLAFRLAAGVAFVDDFVAHAEAAAIDALSAALELTKEDTQDLLRQVHEALFGA